jgi:hypothetical protein
MTIMTTPKISFSCLSCNVVARAEIDLTDPAAPMLRHVWHLAGGDTWADTWKPLTPATEMPE